MLVVVEGLVSLMAPVESLQDLDPKMDYSLEVQDGCSWFHWAILMVFGSNVVLGIKFRTSHILGSVTI